MMVAIDSGIFVTPDGTEHLVRVGMRLRHSHPVVRLSPHTFVPESFDDFEIPQARSELLQARGVVGRD
jgi:hypothetical protein